MPPIDNIILVDNREFTIQNLNHYRGFDMPITTTEIATGGSGSTIPDMEAIRLQREALSTWARPSGTPFDAFVPLKKKTKAIDLDEITKKNVEVFKKVETLRKDMTKLHVDFIREHVENKEMSSLMFLFSRMQIKPVTDKVIESLANNFRPALKEIRYAYRSKDQFVGFFNSYFRNRVLIEDRTQKAIDILVEDMWNFNSIVSNVETELDKLTGKTKVKRTVCEDYLPNNTSRFEIETDDDLF